ncbi:MAG: methionyl-tRNA formyltransferase, partial [Eubacterium sp.]|nr:methionyl-tRNA formyltransferase [Eubacterium sp.]
MRVVYMGTPDFAVLPLKKIYEAGHEVVAVYTQPDKPKGRSKKLVPSDVKVAAEELGIEVYQPEKLRDAESVEILKGLNPDIIVVAAYGQILSEEILNIPKYGCINIHASLLPKYRGASPIEASIINGDEKTGVTIMYMAKGLDTGDIISQVETHIGKHNTETLTAELSKLGAELVVSTMKSLEEGTASRTPQKDEESC